MRTYSTCTMIALFAAGSLCFGGKVYGLSDRPRSEVALLTNASDSHVSIDVIDGVRKGVPSHGVYEFLPGKHTIRVRISYTAARMMWESGPMELTFLAEAAAELKIAVKEVVTKLDNSREGESQGQVMVWVENINTGQLANAPE